MKWSPSLRTKVIFFCLASLLLLGFCLTLAAFYIVENHKRGIVRHAQELAQTRADQLSKRLEELFEEQKAADLAALRQSGRFERAIRLVLTDRHSGSPMLFLVYSQTGQLEYWATPELADEVRIEADAVNGSALAEARQPILHGGEPKGEVVVKYAPGFLLEQIQSEGRRITRWLAVLAGTLAAILTTTFLLLWQVFRRHLEREHAHEQLDRMAYVGTLASGLAHEIRNPLNALSLNLDVIREELATPQPDSMGRTRQLLDLLKSEVGRLNSTLTNFLQLALPSRRRSQPTDVVAVLHETATLLAPDMRKHQIQYRFEGERSCVTLADSSGLRQVFWNVLLNAIQAVEDRDERRIEARCHVEAGQCRIEIRDSGPGISPENRERVFEVFHSTHRGGSGFGLAIARQIIHRHNGAIWIDSVDGWGCAVHIRLPLDVGEPTSDRKTI